MTASCDQLKLRVIQSVIRFGVPKPTEWQRIGDDQSRVYLCAGRMLHVTARLIDLRTCQDSGPGFLAATLRYPLHRVPGDCQYVVERSASLSNGGLQTVSLGAGKIPTHALLVVWRSEVRVQTWK